MGLFAKHAYGACALHEAIDVYYSGHHAELQWSLSSDTDLLLTHCRILVKIWFIMRRRHRPGPAIAPAPAAAARGSPEASSDEACRPRVRVRVRVIINGQFFSHRVSAGLFWRGVKFTQP